MENIVVQTLRPRLSTNVFQFQCHLMSIIHIIDDMSEEALAIKMFGLKLLTEALCICGCGFLFKQERGIQVSLNRNFKNENC